MATYVTFLRYTDQGIRSFKESPARVDAAKRAYQAHGAEMKQFFLLMGPYDMLVVSEAPSDEVVGKIAFTIGSQGNVRTETYKAFTEPEFRKIVSSLT